MAFVSDPTHRRFYGRENDRMPSFAESEQDPATHKVSVRELSLIVDWLRGDYYRASDEQPVLPHSEESARRAVALARGFVTESEQVVGAKPQAELPGQTAERLFRQNCAACHSHVAPGGQGIVAKRPSAPNLFHFGSREWLAGLLDPNRIAAGDYFGSTAHFEGDMVDFVKSNLNDLDDVRQTGLRELVIALSSEAELVSQSAADHDAQAMGVIDRGKQALVTTFTCIDCHKFHDHGDLGSAPDLTGWGSREWLKSMITNPAHSRFYDAKNDRMPAFGASSSSESSLLTAAEIDLLTNWLRGE